MMVTTMYDTSRYIYCVCMYVCMYVFTICPCIYCVSLFVVERSPTVQSLGLPCWERREEGKRDREEGLGRVGGGRRR